MSTRTTGVWRVMPRVLLTLHDSSGSGGWSNKTRNGTFKRELTFAVDSGLYKSCQYRRLGLDSEQVTLILLSYNPVTRGETSISKISHFRTPREGRNIKARTSG